MENSLRACMVDALAIAASRGFLGRARCLVAAGYARSMAQKVGEKGPDHASGWMMACVALEVVSETMRREGIE